MTGRHDRFKAPDWVFNNSELATIASRRADESESAYELAQGIDKSKSMYINSDFYNGDLKQAIASFLSSHDSIIVDKSIVSYRIIYDDDNNYMFALKMGELKNWRHYLVRQSRITRLSQILYFELKDAITHSEFYKNMYED